MIHLIKLENWGPYGELELDLDHAMTVFTGPNGVGKSYLRDAIVFAITGTLRTRRHVAKKNQIAGVAIRDGAKAARVEVLLAGGMRVVRRVTATTQTLELFDPDGTGDRVIPGSSQELQDELYRRLGVDEGRALAALDSRHFLSLVEDERKALLFRALGAGVTAEAVEKAFVARGLTGADVQSLARAAARDGFRRAEQAAIEMRRSAKRRMDELAAIREPERTVTGLNGRTLDLGTIGLEQLELRVSSLEHEHDAMQRSHGRTLGETRALVESHRRQVGELDGEIEAARAAEEPEDLAETEAELGEVETRLSELRGWQEKHRAMLQIADSFERPSPCPAIPGSFACPATAKQLKEHASALREHRDEAKEALAAIDELLAEMLPRHDALHAGVRERRAQADAAKRAAARIPDLERRLSSVRDQLAYAEQVASELEDAGQSKNAEAIAELKTRLARGREIVAAKRAFDAGRAKLAGLAQDRAAAVAQAERANQLVKALESDGIEQDLVREALAPIRERLAETGTLLGAVNVADDLSLVVTIGGRARSESQLSEGQWHALGILMQDALASLPAFPVLLVDEIELLVQEMRGRALGALQRLVSRPYGSVFVFGASERAIPQKPLGGSIGVVWCQGPGVVVTL